MGLIGKILVAKLVTKLTQRLDRAQRDPAPRTEHIPASRGKPVGARGNPRLIALVGAAALALIAAGMSRRRRS